MVASELLPKIWVDEIHIKFVTLKVEGPNHDIFLDSPFNKGLRPIHWSHAHPRSCLVGVKPHPNVDILANIYELQTRKVTCDYMCT
jgi:hypothetical protein